MTAFIALSMSAQTFAKLTIHNQDTNHSIEVLFNPDEYTVNKSNTFAQAAVPGNRAPILQYVHGDLQTLEMELLVDTHEKHENQNQAGNDVRNEKHKNQNRAGDDVRKITTQITDLMNKNPKTHAPPVLLLTWGDSAMGSKSWGNQESFTCVLAKVSQRFVMFLPNGTPVRAKLQVTFHEYADPTLAAKDEKTETADFSALYVVHQGETLSSIANKVYENPTFWRVIALRNQIENPKVLPVGTRLLIPQLPFRDPDSGEVIQ